ncbi:MAG: deoxyribodipyrimidine photolyase, partial [Roseinatronobacter sp.]|nr:deoxyribodipyrimidine photolyase [Roseinatronobacter sp.]
EGLPPVAPLRQPLAPQPGMPTAFVITEEDCRAEDFPRDGLDIVAVATLAASHLRSPGAVSDAVAQFEAKALDDAQARLGLGGARLRAGVPRDLAVWASRAGARQIVTPYIPEGPLRDWLREAQPALDAAGITVCEWRRDWDSAIWPHATAGFFKVKQKIPAILDQALGG